MVLIDQGEEEEEEEEEFIRGFVVLIDQGEEEKEEEEEEEFIQNRTRVRRDF